MRNFKRWDRVKDENFNIFGGSLKNPTLGQGKGVTKNQYIWECLKEGLGQFPDFKGLGKKEGVVIFRGSDTPLNTIQLMENHVLYK